MTCALAVLCLAVQGSAWGAPVQHPSLRAAAEAAAVDQSLILIVFGADWCVPCRELKKKTLESDEFQEQAGDLHLCEIDIDAETDLAGQYEVQEVPTLVLITADRKIVSRRTGFMHTAELLGWLKTSRENARQGKWEGVAPGNRLDEFRSKAKAGHLDRADIERLMALLEDRSPADRDGAAQLIAEQGERAMEALMGGITNHYLGTRIAVAEILQRLAPQAPAFDPWQGPSELSASGVELRKWWTAAGHLPEAAAAGPLDAEAAGSVKAALEALRGNDPIRRTRAMSILVASGSAALPSVREAMKAAEKAGDQISLGLLEDVRWSILVPDEVDQSAGGVRRVLARGKGVERQNAVEALARAGSPGLPALAELAVDPDPLVVERALRALASLSDSRAVAPIAALLASPDSNLRMTAAQALGHLKNPAAVGPLLKAFADPDEVVACAALSAIEEIQTDESGERDSGSPELSQAFKKALTDPRWRVRATAAEAAGKLHLSELSPEVTSLIDDSDGFVAKSALETLKQLNTTPEADQLLALSERHPELNGDLVQILAQARSDTSSAAIEKLYTNSSPAGRLAILRAFAPSRSSGAGAPAPKALLERATREPAADLRQAAVELLGSQPPAVIASILEPLLADEQPGIRALAAGVVLGVLSREPTADHMGQMFESFDASDLESDDSPSVLISSLQHAGSKANKQSPVSPEQLKNWHAALLKGGSKGSDPLVATAIYVTSDSSDLQAFQTMIEQLDPPGMEKLADSAAIGALVERLPWPQGEPILERLLRSPAATLRAAVHALQAPQGTKEFILDPKRFATAVAAAGPREFESSLPTLLNKSAGQWSLQTSDPNSDAILNELLQSTNAGWRTVATCILTLRKTPAALETFERASRDSNAWVRLAAVKGLAAGRHEQTVLEQRLTPLLEDADMKVAAAAAAGLLQPETRSAAGFDQISMQFQYEQIHTWLQTSFHSSSQRPLTALQAKPGFLEIARRRLSGKETETTAMFALLLAQYGDSQGIDRLLEQLKDPASHSEITSMVLAGIALTPKPTHAPFLRKAMMQVSNPYELRSLLQSLRGMTGPEARELRLEINQRLRRAGQ